MSMIGRKCAAQITLMLDTVKLGFDRLHFSWPFSRSVQDSYGPHQVRPLLSISHQGLGTGDRAPQAFLALAVSVPCPHESGKGAHVEQS